jgi:hypothetical protein
MDKMQTNENLKQLIRIGIGTYIAVVELELNDGDVTNRQILDN